MVMGTAKSIARNKPRYNFPLIVWGPYFLASHQIADLAMKRNTHRVVTPEQTIVALDHLLQAGAGVAVTHIPTEDDVKSFLQKLRTFGEKFRASKHKIVVTTTSSLKNKLEKKTLPPYLKLFPNTVESDRLYEYVMTTSDLIRSSDELFKKKNAKKESNIVIIQGDKPEPKSSRYQKPNESQSPSHNRQQIKSKDGRTNFDSISEQDEKLHCINEAIEAGKPSEIWRPKVPGKMEIFLASVNGLKNTFDIYANSKEKEKLKGTQFEEGVDYFFSLKLKRAQVLFRTQVQNPDPEMASFFIPKDMFEVQRRFQFRLNLEDGDRGRASFDPHAKDYEVYNVSASGAALFLPENEVDTFEKGKILHNLKLTIQNKSYTVKEARVQHISTLQHFDSVRVFAGVQFLKMDPKVTTAIAYFVIKRSLDYLEQIKGI